MMDETVPQPEAVSSTPSPTRLPRELIREILSFFWDDREALGDYALVSHDWLLESRPFLFRNINVFNRDQPDRFISNFLHSDRLHPWLTSIHHISFSPTRRDQEGFILDISENLSNLRTMKCQLDLLDFRTDVVRAFSQFERLHHLELVICTFASFGYFKKIIVALPALSSLILHRVSWHKSQAAAPDEPSFASTLGNIRPALSKVSVSTRFSKTKNHTDDVLLWLLMTPTRQLLRELSLDIAHIDAALRLIAGRSEPLAALDVHFYREGDVELLTFGDDAGGSQLRQLFSQVGAIDLLRLHLTYRGDDDMQLSWANVGRILRAFASVASIRRLRFCCGLYGTYLPLTGVPQWGTPSDLTQLDQLLGTPAEDNVNAFRTLRTVQFATCYRDGQEPLEQHYALCRAWVQRTLPKLHERGIAEVYVYDDEYVFGLGGLGSHACGPDFPHAYPPDWPD